MSVPFNPYVQMNAAGSFVLISDGVITGTAFPDPATRFALAGGLLAPTETLPMWGGVGISENVPNEATVAGGPWPDTSLGGSIARATAVGNLTGFSVFDQNYAAVSSPSSPVPQTDVAGLVNFYRLGSGARVALPLTPALVSLEGGLITQAVGWDFANQIIIAGAGFPCRIIKVIGQNCMAPVYDAATGALTWNPNAAAAICVL